MNEILSNMKRPDLERELIACRDKVKQLETCIDIANLINSELALDKLLSNVMETVRTTFNADSASLLLQEEATGDLVFHIALGDAGGKIKELFRMKNGQGVAGLVARTGTPANLKDAYAHPDFSTEYDRRTHYRTRSMLCVPLKARGKTLGVVQVINKRTPPYYFSRQEQDMLVTISSSAAVAIDTARMHELIIQQETLKRDLTLAREVQRSFLPKNLPRAEGWEFEAFNRPALEIGGDFYNVFRLPNNRVGIALGDVSGKGVSAALFMARITCDLQHQSFLYGEPETLLSRVNDIVCRRANHGMFVTLIYMMLDLVTGEIIFSNAGHLPPVLSKDGQTLKVGNDNQKGLPLGVIQGTSYARERLVIGPGEGLTLYTDGITEARGSTGELFSAQRLMDELKRPAVSARGLVTAVSAAVEKFIFGREHSDDMTLVSIIRKQQP